MIHNSESNQGFRFLRISQVGFMVVAIVTSAYSAYVHKAGDIHYVIGPGYRIDYQRIDYVFSRGIIIPIYRHDSIYSIADTGFIGGKIDSNWDVLKNRRKIGNSKFILDAGGVTLQKDGETVSWSGAYKYDAISTEAHTTIKFSVDRVDSIFRNGAGKRFLDSCRIFGFQERVKSIQSSIERTIDSGSAIFQSMIRLSDHACINLNAARMKSMAEYGTNFGSSYECKEYQLSTNETKAK